MARTPLASAYGLDGPSTTSPSPLRWPEAGVIPPRRPARALRRCRRVGRDDQLSHHFLREELRQLRPPRRLPLIFLASPPSCSTSSSAADRHAARPDRHPQGLRLRNPAIGWHYSSSSSGRAGRVAGGVALASGRQGLSASTRVLPLPEPAVRAAARGLALAWRSPGRCPHRHPARGARATRLPPPRRSPGVTHRLPRPPARACGPATVALTTHAMIARHIERRPVRSLLSSPHPMPAG